jgi:23S rRNA (pseudouridine1915-N3)-methyltransferase
MRYVIVAVGHRMPAWVEQAFDDFAKRMPAHARIELVEVKPETRTGGKTVAQMLAAEARRIQDAIPKGATVVALDERGTEWTTVLLKEQMEQWQTRGTDVALLIGGPDGLDASIKAAAQARVRLSGLTLPHAMVRVVLAEALYRAHSLLVGHPYHRA